jgi:hypothetical protein
LYAPIGDLEGGKVTGSKKFRRSVEGPLADAVSTLELDQLRLGEPLLKTRQAHSLYVLDIVDISGEQDGRV